MSDLYEYGFGDSTVRYSRPEERSFLRDHLSNQHLIHPLETIRERQIRDQNFRSNRDFWGKILNASRYYSFRNVILDGFQVVDWFPRSPGLAFTLGAEHARQEAERYLEPGSKFTYLPKGKEFALKGGIGSYRFNPFEYQGTEYCLSTATSDGYCHSGIPLAIPEEYWWVFDADARSIYRIVGKYQFISGPLSRHFVHLASLPKFYFFALSIEPVEEKAWESVRITPVVFMHGENGEGLASYRTCRVESRADLDETREWLSEYADKYHARIVTNYDQQSPVFEDAIFSLQRVMAGDVSIESYLQAGFTEREAHILKTGRTVMNINNSKTINVGRDNTGNIVIGDNNIINQIQTSNASNEIKTMLTELTARVIELCNAIPAEDVQEVKDDLDAFTKEAVKEKPRKKMLEVTAETLKNAAESIRDVGTPVVEIVAKILVILLPLAK